MKHFIIISLLLSTHFTLAQNEDIMQRLQEYGVTQEVLTEHLKEGDGNYTYTVTSKSFAESDADTTVQVATFDPTKGKGERWNLVSVDGNEPSSSDRKLFTKTHKTPKKSVTGRIDDSSLKIEKETDQELVVSFNYAEDAMPKKYSYLRDCKGTIYIDKESEQLKKVEYKNDTPVKVKILKVNNLDMEVDYTWLPDDETYVIEKEVLKMEAEIFGQKASATEINIFSDYDKI